MRSTKPKSARGRGAKGRGKKGRANDRGARGRGARRRKPARARVVPVPKPKTRAEALIWAENLGLAELDNVRGGQAAGQVADPQNPTCRVWEKPNEFEAFKKTKEYKQLSAPGSKLRHCCCQWICPVDTGWVGQNHGL